MLETYPKRVKLVYKNFPIRSHKFAVKAALAAMAAQDQDRFWPYHERLFKRYNRLNDKAFRDIAAELGLDMAAFEAGMKNPENVRRLKKDVKDAQQAGVRGTPTVFINGKLLRNRSVAGFRQQIDAALN